MTLLIDSSGSIGTAMSNVREAVRSVAEGFRETPVKLRIIDFDLTSTTLGSGYYDMADGAQVDAIKALIPNQPGAGTSEPLRANGYTNWDDGWFRTFYQSNGNLRPLDELPFGDAADPLTVEPVQSLGVEDGTAGLYAGEVEAAFQLSQAEEVLVIAAGPPQ